MVILRNSIATYIDNVYASRPAPADTYRSYDSTYSSRDPHTSSRANVMPRPSAHTTMPSKNYNPYSTDRRKPYPDRSSSVSSYRPRYEQRESTFRTSARSTGPKPVPLPPPRSSRRRRSSPPPRPPPRKEVRFDDGQKPAPPSGSRRSVNHNNVPLPPLPPSRPTKYFDREAPPATISESARDTSRRLFKDMKVRPGFDRVETGMTGGSLRSGSMRADAGSGMERVTSRREAGGSGGYVGRRRRTSVVRR